MSNLLFQQLPQGNAHEWNQVESFLFVVNSILSGVTKMAHHLKCLIILMLLGLSGCVSNTATNMPTPLTIIQERPNFVLDVAPREGLILTTNMFEAIPDRKDEIVIDERLLTEFENISAYRSLVCLNVDNIAEVGDDFSESSEIVSRVTMYIDNQKIENIHADGLNFTAIQVVDANSGQVLMQGIGPKSICGKAHPLGAGVHEVLFQFRQTSGNILEYRWLFGLEES